MRIVFLDDNKTVLDFTELMLGKLGAFSEHDQVEKHSSLEDFVASIDENGTGYYDVIVADFDLGPDVISGYEMLITLQKNGFKGKAVLLTGDSSSSMALRMKLSCDIEYVVKNNPKGEDQTARLATIINEVRTGKNNKEEGAENANRID